MHAITAGASADPSPAPASGRCRRSNAVASEAFTSTAQAAFQPKWLNRWALVQPQTSATISTGGAA